MDRSPVRPLIGLLVALFLFGLFGNVEIFRKRRAQKRSPVSITATVLDLDEDDTAKQGIIMIFNKSLCYNNGLYPDMLFCRKREKGG